MISKMFWILVINIALLTKPSHCDASAFDIVLDIMNIPEGEFLTPVEGLDDYPALYFGNTTEPIIIAADHLKINNQVLKTPLAINAIFNIENIKVTTCLFKFVDKNITKLGICITPVNVNNNRVTLITDTLPNKEVNFIVTENIENTWTKLLLTIDQKTISLSINCTEMEVAINEAGNLWNVHIPKESKLHLGNSPDKTNPFKRKTILFWIRRNEETGGDLTPHHRHLYQRATTAEQDGAIVAAHSANPFHSTALSAADYNGVLQEIKIYPDLDKEAVKKLICSEGPMLPDSNDEDFNGENFYLDLHSVPTSTDTTTVPIEKGEKGDIGAPGLQGPQGPPGLIGPTGPKGDDGKCECSYSMVSEIVRNMHELRGAPGIQGEKGDRGKSGDPGPKGDDGLVGSPGSMGPPGPPGPACKECDSRNSTETVKKDVTEGPQGPQGTQEPRELIGVPGLKGEKGNQGIKGDTGRQGELGPMGLKGETGLPGNATTVKLSTILDPENSEYSVFVDNILDNYLRKHKQNLLTNEIKNEVQGPIGPPGPKSEKGHLGPMGQKGPKGSTGAKGAKGTKGEKGAQGARESLDLTKIKGQKGEPGSTTAALPILTGSPGPPGPPGPAGIPGISIVGPKGEPCQVVSFTAGHSYKGDLVNDDDFYTAETVIVRSTTALFKRSSETPLGTLAYVIMEKTLFIRIDGGWQHVMMGPIVKRNAETPKAYRKSSLNEKTQISTSSTKQYIRIVALNFPYRGSMYSIQRGRSKVKSDCNRQARSARIKGVFDPLLYIRGEDLSSLQLASDRNLAIANIRGELLFNSWHAMFNDSEVSLSSPSPAIYSFNGRDVSSDPIWPQKAVWHGLHTSMAHREDCNGWSSQSRYQSGTASPLAYNKLLTPKTYACRSRLIVLCVEIPPS